eukprot:g9990.t1
MCDDESLRHCKAYLRRRLAYGPPVVERESRGEAEEGAAGEQGVSAWGHLWPLGRHVQCEELRRVLRRTVIDRESQSALLLGDTGSGKSLVLDRVLRSLAQEALSSARTAAAGGGKRKRHKKDASGAGGEGGREASSPPPPTTTPPPTPSHQQHEDKQPFRAVYLNGAAQADDGVAMREIVQQLGITAAASQGSIYNSNLAMMVESMKTGAVNGVPVIFVLDVFERFTCRKPQTLLYALLDLCQDKTICAAVVGLSVNLNVLDVAEKRVKSRFSFRQIRFPRQDLNSIVSILADALTVPEGNDNDDNNNSNRKDGPPPAGVTAAFARRFNATTRQTLAAKPNSTTTTSSTITTSGNSVQRSASSSSSSFSSSCASALADLKDLAASGRSVGWFLTLASTAVGQLRDHERGLTRRAVVLAGKMLAPDSHTEALRSLSVTEALALVAMVRLEYRGRRKDGCAFEAVFREYGSFLRTYSTGTDHLRYSRAIIFGAFSRLAEQGVLRSAESGIGGGREAHPMLHCRFRTRFGLDQVRRALEKDVIDAPTVLTQWCKHLE